MSALLDRIAENLALAREDAPPNEKSVHWDVFPDEYAETLRDPEIWRTCLRNALTFNYNDSLYFSPQVAAMLGAIEDTESLPFGTHPLNQIRAEYGYGPLLPETLDPGQNGGQLEKIREIFAMVVAICGQDFVLANLATATGSPSVADLTFRLGEGAEHRVAANYHDLYLVYYAWLIERVLAKTHHGGPRRIVEIGAGYGGLSAKFKDLHPGSTTILFDLPEVNAVQAYYLAERFPEADIRLYADLKTSGPALFEDEAADFIVLPGWAIGGMPAGSADLVVNTRSMMEMTEDVIAGYFDAIHRIVPPGGLFLCINRYSKQPGNIRIKAYPYDDRWRILASQTSNLQGHIHELILERTERPQAFSAADAMAFLPPY